MPTGNTAQFEFNGIQEGKAFKEVVSFTFSNDSKNLAVRSESFVAGNSMAVMEFGVHK